MKVFWNQQLWSSKLSNKLFLVRLITCLGLIAGFLTSWKLWINTRFYPLSPVSSLVPILPPPIDVALFVLIILLLVTVIFYPTKYLFGTLGVLLFYLILQDQSRLQPWVYHYFFLLCTTAWYQCRADRQIQNSRHAILVCQLILVSIYLWSGLHKLNYTYLFETFEWLMGPVLELFPTLQKFPLSILTMGTAFIETGAAIALCFKSTRKSGTWLLITMHIFILLCLGPPGLQYNTVIWPWNICFLLLLVILFLGDNEYSNVPSLFVPKSYYHGLVVVLFLLLPALNFAGFWDHNLSASLYSGKKPYAEIRVNQNVLKKFPHHIQSVFGKRNKINLRNWSLSEMNVPENPQPRIFSQIFKEVCQLQERKYALTMEIFYTADVFTGRRANKILFCKDVR